MPRNVININEGVTRTAEQMVNALLDAEADRLCGARRYEHSAERVLACGQLQQAAANQGRRSEAEGALAALAAL